MAERLAITTEYITLQQLLKITNIIHSGGQAKGYLAEQRVLLNGEEEQRRGKKLYPGDLIETAGQAFTIDRESAEELAEREEKAAILARFQKQQAKSAKAKEKAMTKAARSKRLEQKKTSQKRPTGPSSWN
ncbi:S4 domain-containing protein YaaA [Fructobacillus fructosus]|uniref:S4-like RNA-binding protein (YbcJ) n=1 Tax=Fructobacillus fructosus TaxID=1631 RepID=A0ABN9YL18_9LACO|nr:S4 domain-containing protein YaaA [Fructobacillus fructosus]MBD9365447.1 S4 domain-containing protein YaaA [Leuconostoc mesenteroides]MBC9118783.1 S4 domain-containing protein YaaA [Fructobacillus fructosus]MCK8637852.1 S4 domain-containing protein YaaA [Fructobacillus fructosus]CAK1230240.1 Ribosome-associated protein YbcJ [Fructobacillus fructosus]CAK1233562.1 Ribosome-associated protein YbcJ [Fructobacillus fructosus]